MARTELRLREESRGGGGAQSTKLAVGMAGKTRGGSELTSFVKQSSLLTNVSHRIVKYQSGKLDDAVCTLQLH